MIKDGKEIIYKKSVSGCIKEYGAGIGEKVAAVFLDERKEFFYSFWGWKNADYANYKLIIDADILP